MRKDKLLIVLSGIIIGLATGTIVSSFRWIISQIMKIMLALYSNARHNFMFVILILTINIFIAIFVSTLMKQEKNINGSGIPQVEGQLMQKLDYDFWPVLWRKFIAGSLAIGSGLFLGREGPSIQLGSTTAQGIAALLHQDPKRTRLFIAGGAAAGLSAAFNAPIAGTFFILEEVYHRFEAKTILIILTATLSSNFVSTIIFGQVPVLHIPLPKSFPLPQYFHLIVLGIALGLLGRIYQKVTLNVGNWYHKYCSFLGNYKLILPLILIVPIGIWVPQTLGGGNNLIILVAKTLPGITIFLGYFLIRFIFSALSYGTGTPGGIFLPILTLGALIGGLYGQIMVSAGLLQEEFIVNLIVFAMAGYFGCISKAPFTAILLITETVGTVEFLMPMAIVTLSAYITVDLLNGRPIYLVMMENYLLDQRRQKILTLIERRKISCVII